MIQSHIYTVPNFCEDLVVFSTGVNNVYNIVAQSTALDKLIDILKRLVGSVVFYPFPVWAVAECVLSH
uniref:Uncharacterized protein n=1 Tax=Bionectria ochroleuca TaxID=29856 RepID=A0A0B7KIE3_BIOOC